MHVKAFHVGMLCVSRTWQSFISQSAFVRTVLNPEPATGVSKCFVQSEKEPTLPPENARLRQWPRKTPLRKKPRAGPSSAFHVMEIPVKVSTIVVLTGCPFHHLLPRSSWTRGHSSAGFCPGCPASEDGGSLHPGQFARLSLGQHSNHQRSHSHL